MALRRNQWLLIVGSVAALLTLYLGCPVQAPDMVQAAARRSLEIESTSPQALMRAANAEMEGVDRAILTGLDEELSRAETDAEKLPLLERLASEWYRLDEAGVSGYYAQRIAEIRDTSARAWSIAGTTFSICVRQADNEKEKDFCTQRAIKAYQNAISLEPGVVEHQLNLSLTYTYNPPPENPMKGILMLRELQQNNPTDVSVLLTLARLSIQTNQLDKARQRLDQARQLEPNNPEPYCLLSRIHERLGQLDLAAINATRCESLRTNEVARSAQGG